MCVHVYAKLLQSYLTLFNTMNHSPPGSSDHGILQARILEWVAMPSSKSSSQPRDQPTSLMSLALTGKIFTTSATWQALRSSIQSAKTKPEADCGSDHEPLIAKFRLKLNKVTKIIPKKKKCKKTKWLSKEALQTADERNEVKGK